MDASDIDRAGRSFGVCLVMWNNALNINVKSIATTSNRICATEINNKRLKMFDNFHINARK